MLLRCSRFTVFWLGLAALVGTGQAQFIIDSLCVNGAQVTAFDSGGDSLWTYTAPGPVNTTELGDINGDMYPEVAVGTTSAAFGIVIDVRNNGTEFWQFQTGDTGVFWPDSHYNVSQIDISDLNGDGHKEIISSSNHATFFPSRLCVLSDSGSLLGEYWNPGQAGVFAQSMIEADLDSNGIQEIIVDCINNDLGFIRCVFLLEGDNIHGQAPPYFGIGDHGTQRWYFTSHNSAVSQFEVISDIDGDGWRDLRIHYTDGQEIVLSGSTGTIIQPLVEPPFVDCLDDSLLQNWTLWGEPLPLWRPSVHNRQGVFDNNGDPNDNSGAISNAVFDISNGFNLQADVYLEFVNWADCWLRAAIGIANPTYQSWGGYEPYVFMEFLQSGDLCTDDPPEWRHHHLVLWHYLSANGWIDNLTSPWFADSYPGFWVTMKIVVDSVTHIPSFYMGNTLIFAGTVPIADSVLTTPRPIWIGEQSSGFGGKVYHDWIGFNVGAPPPVLEVTSPGWGDQWRIGQVDAAEVRWAHTGVTGTIRIDLYRNGTAFQNIASGVNINNPAFNWTVPEGVPEGEGYQIFVQSEAELEVQHLGAPFGILAPVVIPSGFYDNFTATNLDQWTLWGSPVPLWVAGAQGRTGLFDNHGDADYPSGAISQDWLDFSGGFTIESDILVDFYNPAGCWLSAFLGISDTIFDNAWGGYDRVLEFGLNSPGDACWVVPEQYRRHTWFGGFYQTDQGTEYVGGADWPERINADDFANAWHTFSIRVDSATWIPLFYADDNLIYAGTQPLAQSVRNLMHPLAIHGNSFGWAGRAYHDEVRLISQRVEIATPPNASPIRSFQLEQNYPNPFNQSTLIRYELAAPAKVRLAVYDILGQEVVSLFEGQKPAGAFVAEWDGRSSTGTEAASGVYLCALKSGDGHSFRKMVLLR